MKTNIILLLAIVIFFACKKEAEYKPIPTGNSSNATHNHTNSSSIGEEAPSNELHKVVVKKTVPAAKYMYLHVEENGETFWIAIIKQDITIGKTYYYNRALLKTNFESKETGKFFDKIYLVTSLVSEDHAQNTSMQMPTELVTQEIPENVSTNKITEQTELIQKEGSVKIADLVNNPKKYEGKTIQISGKCFKINPNIMDRNWIHLQDGSKDDYDLVITSNEFVTEGSVVTMKGVVTLNKDFGAGYSYELIIEEGVVVR